MDRSNWYLLYREVRTGVSEVNLFPASQRAVIALQMARVDKKERWNDIQRALYGCKKDRH